MSCHGVTIPAGADCCGSAGYGLAYFCPKGYVCMGKSNCWAVWALVLLILGCIGGFSFFVFLVFYSRRRRQQRLLAMQQQGGAVGGVTQPLAPGQQPAYGQPPAPGYGQPVAGQYQQQPAGYGVPPPPQKP